MRHLKKDEKQEGRQDEIRIFQQLGAAAGHPLAQYLRAEDAARRSSSRITLRLTGEELFEGARRQKTPNEIALNILRAVLTLILLLVVVTLQPFAAYAKATVSVPVLISLHRFGCILTSGVAIIKMQACEPR